MIEYRIAVKYFSEIFYNNLKTKLVGILWQCQNSLLELNKL